MQYNLLDFLSKVNDSRRAQGVRHPITVFFALIILAILSGHQGLRGFTRFCKSNEQELVKTFSLRHGVPSYGTVRSLLRSIDFDVLCEVFAAWMKEHLPKDDEIWVSLDGKALCSTVQNPGDSLQNFVYMVSTFAHRTGLVFSVATFQSGKSGEADVVRDMIAQLGLSEGIIILDALHCQKKL